MWALLSVFVWGNVTPLEKEEGVFSQCVFNSSLHPAIMFCRGKTTLLSGRIWTSYKYFSAVVSTISPVVCVFTAVIYKDLHSASQCFTNN